MSNTEHNLLYLSIYLLFHCFLSQLIPTVCPVAIACPSVLGISQV